MNREFLYWLFIFFACIALIFGFSAAISDIRGLNRDIAQMQVQVDDLTNDQITMRDKLDGMAAAQEIICLGTFKVYAYTASAQECGKSDGITFTGTKVTVGRTIAVDPAIIPLGSKVYLDGRGPYIAEDIGGGIKGKKIDLFFGDDRQKAFEWGVREMEVSIEKLN